MDRRMFLAIGLSMLVIIVFYAIFPPAQSPPPEFPPGEGPVENRPADGRRGLGQADPAGVQPRSAPRDADSPPPGEAEEARGRLVTVKTPHYTAQFDTRGGKLVSLRLDEYRVAKSSIDWGEVIPPLRAYIDRTEFDQTAHVNMVKRELRGLDTLGLWFVDESALTRELSEAIFTADRTEIVVDESTGPRSLKLTGRTGSGLTVTKSLTFHPDSFVIDYKVALINYGREEMPLRVRHVFGEGPETTLSDGGFRSHIGPMYEVDDSVDTEDAEDLELLLPVRDPAWVGITDAYFLTAASPESPISYAYYQSEPLPGPGGDPIWVPHYGVELPVVALAPNKLIESRFRLYYGPKKTDELEKFGLGLEKSLDMNLEILATPLLMLLRWFHGFTGNYGVAIILLTIVVRVTLFPLTYKGMVSMKRMQRLQPRMKTIREKFKGDKERINKEMMGLYKRAKVNPIGGCLPILLQLPIFFALYSALGGAIELRHSPFIFWIADLSAKDGLYITPILMGGSMMIQQRLTPSTPDPMQAKILMWMPAIFTIFMLSFPAGLTVYWFTSNLLSILQQLVINRIKIADPTE